MSHFSENNMLRASEESVPLMASWKWWHDFIPWVAQKILSLKQCNTILTKPKASISTRKPGLVPLAPQENTFQSSSESVRVSLEFLSGAGTPLIFFYRTGCEKSFLAEFLFYNQNNSREVKWLFFWDFFLSLSPGQSRKRKRERKKNPTKCKTFRQKL